MRKMLGYCSFRLMEAVILAFLFLTFTALAQTPDQGDSAKTDPGETQKADKQKKEKKEKKGEWIFAPIPISSPAIGSGLEWAVGYMFPFSKQGKKSPNSVVGAGGLFTNNGSKAIAVGGRLYLKEDKYRFTMAAGGAKINADIYGIGKQAGDRGLFLPLTASGSGFMVEPLFIRLGKTFHLGARFQYRDLTLKLNRDEMNLPEGVEPPEWLKEIIAEVAADLFQQRTIAVGPRFQWDTRDDAYYPRKGIFLDSGIDLFAEAIGSKYTYQYYKFTFNKYAGLGKGNVIAFRGMACGAAGDHVPIYDLCLFGNSNDLRGYAAGRYQDRRMFATQAEYRINVPSNKFIGRFGAVVFGGVGGVAGRFSDMRWDDLLPAGGGGIRFRMTNKDHVNFRIDYGIGRVGHTFTMGIGEAF